MTDFAQPVTVSDDFRLPVFNTIGATFRIFGRAPLFFLLFAVIGAIPAGLPLVFSAMEQQHTYVLAGITFVVGILLSGFLETVMTYGAAQIEGGEAASIGEAFSVGPSRYLPMLGMTIVYWLSILLGSILLVIPGIILLTMFSLAAPVCALEKLGPIASLKRSRVLTEGSLWRIFDIFVLFVCFSALLEYVASSLLHGPFVPVADVVVSAIYTPFGTIFPTVIYLHLRRFKEHVGVGAVFD